MYYFLHQHNISVTFNNISYFSIAIENSCLYIHFTPKFVSTVDKYSLPPLSHDNDRSDLRHLCVEGK